MLSETEFVQLPLGQPAETSVDAALALVLEDLISGETFRAGEKVERAVIDKREMQFLYREGDDYVFMDNTSYEQLNVAPETLGSTASYLVEGNAAILLMFGDEIVGVDLPAAVVLTITDTEPGIQGDRVSGATKQATLETGLVVQVPLFLNPGESVKVDTRSGDFLGRYKE